jgi:hypothetical protein
MLVDTVLQFLIFAAYGAEQTREMC